MDVNPEEFHKSISRELKTIQDRIRNLIGDAHWGEEGKYKEAILKNVIRRFLPANMNVATGFIVKKENNSAKVSSQIDIIIYDNTYPVLFVEGDFIITTPVNVKAIIEVKTKLNSSTFKEALLKATKNGRFLIQNVPRLNFQRRRKEMFNGIFVYNKGGISIETPTLEQPLRNSGGIVNYICLGENVFIKYWYKRMPENDHNRKYSVYRIKQLSFSYFISNLIEHVSDTRMSERRWFLYPSRKVRKAIRLKMYPFRVFHQR